MGANLIVACLRRYRDHLASTPSTSDFKAISFAEIVSAAEQTADEEIAEDLDDAICSALLYRVREEGWKAYLKGGVAEMKRVSDQVEGLMSEAPSWAGATLDKWWDEIGQGEDRWWS